MDAEYVMQNMLCRICFAAENTFLFGYITLSEILSHRVVQSRKGRNAAAKSD